VTRTGPFTGLRVVELSRLLPGAYATLLLADLGADVVKLEEPGRGDYMRWIAPMSDEDFGTLFSATGRNKRSVTADLKSPEGVAFALDLVAAADVVVEGFRPGVADRLGIGYAAARARNRGIVYCSISGYGATGPLADRPGHDLNYLASAGVLDMTLGPEGRPALPGMQMADVWGGGLAPAFAILATLWERQRTGEGRHLDTGMYDGSSAALVNYVTAWTRGGERFERGAMLLSGGVPNYDVYPAKDGWVSVACTEEKFWRRFCELIDEPDLASAHDTTGAEADAVRARIAERLRERTRAEWDALLGGPETCFAPVLTIDEAIEDEHFLARGLICEVDVDGVAERQLATPSASLGSGEHTRAPRLGEHDDEVRAELRAAAAVA
jgi:crotonobetainyl-CoA:carnitine CoA-transferase CaiB-like acyl-CoA transferase